MYGNCIINNSTNKSKSAVYCTHYFDFFAQMGAAHVLNLEEKIEKNSSHLLSNNLMTVLVRPNSVNMLWQVPQYIVITAGEVLFSITGLEFSYSQASPTMRSVLQVITNLFF